MTPIITQNSVPGNDSLAKNQTNKLPWTRHSYADKTRPLSTATFEKGKKK